MKTIILESLPLSTYTRLCTVISVCLGFVVGVLMFLAIFLFGIQISIRFGTLSMEGVPLGIVAVFIGPFVAATTGYVGSLLSYRLFLLTLGWVSGLSVSGRWKDLPPGGNDVEISRLQAEA